MTDKEKPEQKARELLIGYDCKLCNTVHIYTAAWEEDTDKNPVCRAAMNKAIREEICENLWAVAVRMYSDTHGNVKFMPENVIEDQEKLRHIRERQDIAARVPMGESDK